MSSHESYVTSRYGNQGAGRAQEKAAGAMHRATDQARSYFEQGYHSAEDLVTHHPASSALIVFGVGLGLGILIGNALSGAAPPRSRYLNRHKAERVGQKVLDALAEYLPEPIASRIS